MMTGIRHASRLKLAVKNSLHSPQLTLALLAGGGDVINLVSVYVGYLAFVSA